MVTWQGPDFLNVLGVSRDDLPTLKGAAGTLDQQLATFGAKFKTELFNRELLYYSQLFINEVPEKDFEAIFRHLKSFEGNLESLEFGAKASAAGLGHGMALLIGRSKRFFIRKLASVVGRKPTTGRLPNVSWQVDINLKDNKKVSKQHAVILWNFQTRQFEIKCLSLKYPIRVNNVRYSMHDDPVPLDGGALVAIGGENFYFQLPSK